VSSYTPNGAYNTVAVYSDHLQHTLRIIHLVGAAKISD
jgi:hypothetical protein